MNFALSYKKCKKKKENASRVATGPIVNADRCEIAETTTNEAKE